MDKLRYVFDAVTSIRKALNGRVPLIGFSGSPWTLACYMVEGAGSDDYRLVKTMLYSRPDLMHRMLAVNADAVAAYLNAQIDAGAQAVMIFDSWGGVLADGAFQQFSLAYTRARAGATASASTTGGACRASSSPRAAACGSRRSRRSAARCSASTGPSTSARARARVGDRRGAAGQPRPERAVRRRRRRSTPRSRKVLDSFGAPHRGDGRGAATSSTWATASASTRRRSTWRRWSRRCIASRARLHGRVGVTGVHASARHVTLVRVSEHSGLDLSPKLRCCARMRSSLLRRILLQNR